MNTCSKDGCDAEAAAEWILKIRGKAILTVYACADHKSLLEDVRSQILETAEQETKR